MDKEFIRTDIYSNSIYKNKIPEETCAQAIVRFSDGNGNKFGLTPDMLSQHLLMLGGIGSGKTNAFYFILEALSNRLTSNDILFVFDSKGDFAERFFQPDCEEHIMIGLGEKYSSYSKYWNLFDELRDEDGHFNKAEYPIMAREIAKQFFLGRKSSTQPFFCDAAIDLVSKVMIDFIREAERTQDESKLNNAAFAEWFHRAGADSYIKMLNKPGNEDFRGAGFYIGGHENDQALGVIAEINNAIYDLFISIFAETGQNGSFAVRQLVREKGGKIIFFEYDLSMDQSINAMYRMLFDLALKESLGGRNISRGNVYYLIDEFKLLPKSIHIEDALNFGRSQGVRIFAGLQSISQLYAIYGDENAGKNGHDIGNTLNSGFINSFCFRTMDAESREFIKGRFGRNYYNLAFSSLGTPLNIQREGYTVEDWDILSLNVGQAFINLGGIPPFVFRFPKFEAAEGRV